MLGIIFYSIAFLFALSQIYFVNGIIRQKRINSDLLTFDIIEIVLSVSIVLIDSAEKPEFINYFLSILVVFIFLKIAISSVVINWEIVKKYKIYFLALALIMVVVTGFAMRFTREKQNENQVLAPITTTEFIQLENSIPEDMLIVYIGKPDCKACSEAQPEIQKLAQEEELNAYYYDTQAAREQGEEQMYALLNRYGVSVVPSVVIFYNNGTVRTLTGNHVVDELNNLI